MSLQIPTRQELSYTLVRIRPYVHQTPVLTSQLLNNIAGCELYFKCENFQKVGAFKFRGATNAVLQLSDEEKKQGVATHSSGNHAQALALAAKTQGIKAYIVMPTSAPKVKSDAVADYGAEIIWCEPTLKSREDTLEKVVGETGSTVIHPYDNHNVICGQSTVTQELLESHNDLDILITPVGGGGLLSGSSLAAKYFNQQIKVYGAEPEGAKDAWESFTKGVLVPSVNPNTIADGLLTSLSERTFNIIQQNVDDILLVNDEEIKEAMHLIWERLKIVVEPSGAVTLAAVLKNGELFKNKKVGLVLSGGNVDLKKFSF
ncbi:MAG: pyridoxal-phosphate dependent enzyme [Bacteroidota bacterium]